MTSRSRSPRNAGSRRGRSTVARAVPHAAARPATITLAERRFPSYDIRVADETINGVPVTEAQIAAWANEAEAGYDVAVLRERGRGRPGRGAEPSQVVAVRLTTAELQALDARAVREHKTRSQVVREALAVASGA